MLGREFVKRVRLDGPSAAVKPNQELQTTGDGNGPQGMLP